MSLRFVLGRFHSEPMEEYYREDNARQMEPERRYRPRMMPYQEPEENLYSDSRMGYAAPVRSKRRESVEYIARQAVMEMMDDVKEELKQELGSAKSMTKGLVKEAEEVLHNPPKTWAGKDAESILRMELHELDRALSSGQGIGKEAKHVMAALMKMEDE